jgi:hypothetical protein
MVCAPSSFAHSDSSLEMSIPRGSAAIPRTRSTPAESPGLTTRESAQGSSLGAPCRITDCSRRQSVALRGRASRRHGERARQAGRERAASDPASRSSTSDRGRQLLATSDRWRSRAEHKPRPIRSGAGVQTSRRSPQIWVHSVIANCPIQTVSAVIRSPAGTVSAGVLFRMVRCPR